MKTAALALYNKYHVDRGDERTGMFTALAEHFSIARILYPGCFVHVTPSFVFPKATYVDMEKRAKQFFTKPELQQMIFERKLHPQAPKVQFHHQDYTKGLPEDDQSFDLLISQYAGFVSQHCKRYLKIGRWLVANNSHGDASMAYLDNAYKFVGVINRKGESFHFSNNNLGAYFVPKKDIQISKEQLEERQRGIGYRKSSFAYVFQRIQ